MVKRARQRRFNRLIFAAALIIFLAVGITAAWNLIAIRQDYQAAQNEYDKLRREYAPAAITPAAAQEPDTSALITTAKPEEPSEPQPKSDLSDLNSDYIGWIRINGTDIDYPVARGQDNEKYLTMSFSGKKSKSGAIYMDYRCTEGFGGSYAILFGHNMRDNTMFAGLNCYLEDGYLEKHPEITITTPDGETLDYQIFKVKITDMYDPAYGLMEQTQQDMDSYLAALGAPEGVRILVLSTCTNSAARADRLLIFAARG